MENSPEPFELDLDDALAERLTRLSVETGLAPATIIKLSLEAGLPEFENSEQLKKDSRKENAGD